MMAAGNMLWKRAPCGRLRSCTLRRCNQTQIIHRNNKRHQNSEHLKRLQNSSELLNQIDAVIFDCDGVIWKGDTMIQNADKMLKYLRSQGKRIFFFTNSSMKSRRGYFEKFERLGIKVLEEG